jgi:antirestriction protein ArdC
MSKKVANVVVKPIMEKLEEGVVPWRKPWRKSKTNTMSYHGREYKGINYFLTLISGRKGPWITKNQVRKQGGRVKSEEWKKGLPIILWKWIEKEEEDASGVKRKKRFPMIRFYVVWSLDQCDGVDDPAWLKKIKAGEKVQQNDPIEAAEDLWEGYSDKPDVLFGFNHACYCKVPDKIEMPNRNDFHSAEEYYSTLFHEGAHSTGHASRLGRLGTEESTTIFGSADYSKEELVAELSASMLMAECGIDWENTTLDNSAAYIKNWMDKLTDDPKILITAAQQAQKAVDHITGNAYDPKKD